MLLETIKCVKLPITGSIKIETQQNCLSILNIYSSNIPKHCYLSRSNLRTGISLNIKRIKSQTAKNKTFIYKKNPINLCQRYVQMERTEYD